MNFEQFAARRSAVAVMTEPVVLIEDEHTRCDSEPARLETETAVNLCAR
jgi:hypothetical protein